MKFKSGRLKQSNYDINISYDDANSLGEIIKLFDGQMLRTVRDVARHCILFNRVERMYSECEIITKKLRKKISKDYSEFLTDRLKYLRSRIERSLFVEDMLFIEIEHNAHYAKLFRDGLKVNGKVYKRLSCSASQARSSTVTFCNVNIIDEVKRRLNNGRDTSVPLSPSKFNAYFGLSGSCTMEVSEPRFCVVPDYENDETFDAYYVKETDFDKDDEIERRTVTLKMNRADGMGIISPTQASKWANELGLDYVPSEFGIRQSFIKGMCCVFDFIKFCKEKNGGNYMVDTVYKDECGNPIMADLREVDIILSESQFKLWNCYKSVEEYIDNCHKNGLRWGVPQYSPKKPKNILKMNYQFLQTLNLDEDKVSELTAPFEEWIRGVSFEDPSYMKLFLMGINLTEDKIRGFMHSDAPEWQKALVANPEMKNDKYIRGKVRALIRKKIENGCLGEIFVEGNFQTLVSDPYAFMQHICGQEPTGLLGKGEMYSGYWNSKGVKRIDVMRAPLTFRSEHVVDNLVINDDTETWYRYLQHGLIVNWHDHEANRLGGADFDLDIAASVSDPVIVDNTYSDELTMVYDVPKPSKKILKDEDLYNSDLFGFGSIIGSITNKSSSAYALIANLNEGTEEYRITHSRLIQCCKAQGSQIDKTKIGRAVKGIPEIWTRFRHIDDSDTEEVKKEKKFYNSILLDKYPYFFIYRYPDCKKKFHDYKERVDITCQQKYRMSIDELQQLERPTDEQSKLIANYYKYMPVIVSNSPMNLLCRRIEKLNDCISKRSKIDEFDYTILKYQDIEYSRKEYNLVAEAIKKYMAARRAAATSGVDVECDEDKYSIMCEAAERELLRVLPDVRMTVNILIDYFYRDNPQKSRDILWGVFGNYLVKNITGDTVSIPLPREDGEIEYLGERYSETEIEI